MDRKLGIVAQKAAQEAHARVVRLLTTSLKNICVYIKRILNQHVKAIKKLD